MSNAPEEIFKLVRGSGSSSSSNLIPASSRNSSMERQDSNESRDFREKSRTPTKDGSSSSDRPLQRPPSLSNLSSIGSIRGSTPLSVIRNINTFHNIKLIFKKISCYSTMQSSRGASSRTGTLRNQSSFETNV